MGKRNVFDKQGRMIGTIHQGAYRQWYACPRNSQVTMIPCVSRKDAIDTVHGLGMSYDEPRHVNHQLGVLESALSLERGESEYDSEGRLVRMRDALASPPVTMPT